MNKATRIIALAIIGMVFFSTALTLCTFVGTRTPFDVVVADAARLFGLEEDEFEIVFVDDLRTRDGMQVHGMHTSVRVGEDKHIHRIQIRNHPIRVIMTATIFHEFAHAAQIKYDMDFGDYNVEQHAEILSFQTMWNGGYRWDALHLLPLHALGGKNEFYNVRSELFQVVRTGNFVFSNPSVLGAEICDLDVA
jgi:hypothetical protein